MASAIIGGFSRVRGQWSVCGCLEIMTASITECFPLTSRVGYINTISFNSRASFWDRHFCHLYVVISLKVPSKGRVHYIWQLSTYMLCPAQMGGGCTRHHTSPHAITHPQHGWDREEFVSVPYVPHLFSTLPIASPAGKDMKSMTSEVAKAKNKKKQKNQPTQEDFIKGDLWTGGRAQQRKCFPCKHENPSLVCIPRTFVKGRCSGPCLCEYVWGDVEMGP